MIDVGKKAPSFSLESDEEKKVALKDFLGQKRYINDKIVAHQKDSTISAWLDERMKDTDIEIFEDVLWSTVDMDKYPSEKTE